MSCSSLSERSSPFMRRFAAVLMGATALVGVSAAQAQEISPSQNVTVNLIRALVAKGVLSQGEADAMIVQAEAEAEQARASAQAAQTAVAAVSPTSAQPGVSVRYVPQFVRDEIKAEVRQEVLADARAQGLVAPDALPQWVRGVKITGDLRVRDEARFFDSRNALDFVNIGAINNGAPYNTDPVTNPNNPPIINSRRDRNFLQLRARIGLEAAINPDLTAYFRVATGERRSPVSTNQTMGGYFSGKDLWLDRAYVDYHPAEGASLLLGRMGNPFHMSELVWDEDVNLDGLSLQYARPFGETIKAYVLGGAFPLDYVNADFPATGLSNIKVGASKDKWLFAGQIGAAWSPDDRIKLGLNLAYFDYVNVEGQLSPSCSNLADYCLTDYSRPGFSQRGNTLFALRDITTNDPANQAAPQYYGLASKFQVLAFAADLDWRLSDQLKVSLTGHYSKNLGYDREALFARGFNPNTGLSQIVNNNETCRVDLSGGLCPPGQSVFKSGDTAWLLRAALGSGDMTAVGDWTISASYRHIDPDALLDAFTDSDFHLGGTNAKGWTLGGSYGVLNNTWLGLRWINSQELSGPPFRVNLLQGDLSFKF